MKNVSKHRVKVFYDGETIIDKELKSKFKYEQTIFSHNANDELKIDGVGIAYINDQFIASLPKGLVQGCSIDDYKKIRVLVKALSNYKTQCLIDGQKNALIEEGLSSSFIFSALNIIDFWIKFGHPNIYKHNYKSSDPDKIDWKKTIQSQWPFIQRNAPIYTGLLGSNIRRDEFSIFNVLFEKALEKSTQICGFLYSENNLHYTAKLSNELTPDEIRYHIRKLKTSTYEQSKIRLLDDIFNVLLENSLTGNERFCFFTKQYHFVWEKMLSSVFGSEYNRLSNYIPNIETRLTHGLSWPSYKQIPDILFEEKDELYILDAKYYDLETSFPSKNDIIKQMFYDLTSTKSGTTYNALLFSGSTINRVENIGESRVAVTINSVRRDLDGKFLVIDHYILIAHDIENVRSVL